MMKKAMSVVLLFMILSAFTACGQKSSTAQDISETASGTTVETASETTVEASSQADSQASQTGESMPAAAPTASTEGETAEVPAVPDGGLPLEEQHRILEENRSLWAFDEDEYSPDWYYTFTDLDRNGLLEVLSASTQGSGIFTYAHFYEVLPDGSGVRNLYHADVDVEGIDDWPEIILESIPSYYDKDSDRYYYICTNNTRDGAAHAISQLAALCLKDGTAEWEYLASMEIQDTEDGEQTTYLDSKGSPITEQDYNRAVDSRFAGMESSELKLEWTAVTAQ